MENGFKELLEHLQRTGAGLTDRQLLGRFVADRDEESFTAIVRRHGPMVLGVCRRVLHDFHDAEDAFQATFFLLARKAGSIVKRESLSCWLYGVAYRTALRARALAARRQAHEKPVKNLPHPVTTPDEARDWLPLLDRELNLLPEKYRAAIVLCDLQGRTRREAAGLLGVPEGTLSSRLAAGRELLARRLSRGGVTLAGGALVMVPGAALAEVPSSLAGLTAKAAAAVAAGQLTAISPAVVLLMKGMLNAMLMNKVRMLVGAVIVLVAFGAVGLGHRAADTSSAAHAAPADKPASELDALRKENELLRLNLQVVLEKVRAQETELRELKGRQPGAGMPRMPGGGMGGFTDLSPTSPLAPPPMGGSGGTTSRGFGVFLPGTGAGPMAPMPGAGGMMGVGAVRDPLQEIESAVKALREARDKEGERRALDAFEKAMKKLRAQPK